MSRMWAIVEREMRRFRRSPMLIVMSMVFPLAQLVILGYAFGGNVKHLKLAVVDHELRVHGVESLLALPRAGSQVGTTFTRSGADARSRKPSLSVPTS